MYGRTARAHTEIRENPYQKSESIIKISIICVKKNYFNHPSFLYYSIVQASAPTAVIFIIFQ